MDKQIKVYLDKIIKVMKNDFPLFKNMRDYGFYDQLSNEEMNYVFSGVFKQPVKIRGYVLFNENGNLIYEESYNGEWTKREYNDNGNRIYYETSNGRWIKYEYDKNGNVIYHENSKYYEDSHGEIEIVDNR